jgi:hypothetical protein
MTDWNENKSISMLRKAKEGGYAVLAQVWYVRHLFLRLLTIHGIGDSLHVELTPNNLTLNFDL